MLNKDAESSGKSDHLRFRVEPSNILLHHNQCRWRRHLCSFPGLPARWVYGDEPSNVFVLGEVKIGKYKFSPRSTPRLLIDDEFWRRIRGRFRLGGAGCCRTGR